ncbi:MAG: hypothetical protein H7Z19_21580 [Chitinophagaceae bacterium]|nr:hypothetical protein [Rubrivivax sp.]
MKLFVKPLSLACAAAAMGMTACGGGDFVANIGGSASGLNAGQSVTLQNNGRDDTLTVTQNGRFTFGKRLVLGERYNVTIRDQPSSQVCLLSNSSGWVNSDSDDVTDIVLVCFNR